MSSEGVLDNPEESSFFNIQQTNSYINANHKDTNSIESSTGANDIESLFIHKESSSTPLELEPNSQDLEYYNTINDKAAKYNIETNNFSLRGSSLTSLKTGAVYKVELPLPLKEFLQEIVKTEVCDVIFSHIELERQNSSKKVKSLACKTLQFQV